SSIVSPCPLKPSKVPPCRTNLKRSYSYSRRTSRVLSTTSKPYVAWIIPDGPAFFSERQHGHRTALATATHQFLGEREDVEELSTGRTARQSDDSCTGFLYRKRAVLAGEQPVFTREQAPSSTLSFCWTTLDILLMQLGTIHSEGLTRAQSEFDHLRMKTHMYVHARERGFRVTQLTPLLEILDIVARGRRLLMVFSDHLEYHSRTDIVFGREYLQNSDLLQAFAHCLPEFIATNPPEVGRRFMEDIVNRDGLWTSLLTGLSITEWSDSPLSYWLRVFENVVPSSMLLSPP
ncbi:hypothetical protein BGY98DRAFT_1000415, partial [Russula aff. rugulosa BPL654]